MISIDLTGTFLPPLSQLFGRLPQVYEPQAKNCTTCVLHMSQMSQMTHLFCLACLQEGAPGAYRPEFGRGGYGRGAAPPS